MEFAIMVPLVLLVIFEVMGWAYMFSFRQALSQAADEGARAAIGGGTNCPTTGTWTSSCAGQTAATTAIASALSDYSYGGAKLVCGGAAGLVCTIAGTASCPATHTCVSVTISYPYRSQPLLGGLPTNVGPFNLVLPPNLTFTSIVQVS